MATPLSRRPEPGSESPQTVPATGQYRLPATLAGPAG